MCSEATVGPEPQGSEIGVLIVDDHRMFAESLSRLLSDEDGITVLGIAGSGAEALEMAGRLSPKVVLIDYQMPDQDGVTVSRAIKVREPSTMVVMLTGSTDDRVLLAAIDAGCSGFLTKDRAAAEVIEAVRSAASGEAVISPALLARLLPKLTRTQRSPGDDLTERERQLLGYLAQGMNNRVIASQMHLSVNTVRNYVQSVLQKLNAHSKLEAVAAAVRAGVIEYPARA
jgi:DNA-binding NarL/FixJ family response regulator